MNINKSNRKVDIIVFRTNKKGENLMMAKSCGNCKFCIDKTLQSKNYKLRNFYYTDKDGELTKDYI